MNQKQPSYTRALLDIYEPHFTRMVTFIGLTAAGATVTMLSILFNDSSMSVLYTHLLIKPLESFTLAILLITVVYIGKFLLAWINHYLMIENPMPTPLPLMFRWLAIITSICISLSGLIAAWLVQDGMREGIFVISKAAEALGLEGIDS